eukprot:gene11899-13802_t
MERQRQGAVPYNIGSMEHATPRVVSMLKNSPYSGRTEGVNLKQDIMSTLSFVNDERNAWQKMQLASMMLAKSMSRASLDDVAKLNHRWQEVSVLCQIQLVKRESLKYNTELQRTFQHGTVDNLNIKRKIVRPEHFERGTPHSLKPTKPTSKMHFSKTTAKPVLNPIQNVTSPWEGSQFKYELLCSLRAKLIKKLVLAAFKCYKQMQLNNRQCIATCHRSKFRRLMQLCFSALLLEALSAKYIVFAANVNTRKLITRKYLLPSLHSLQRFAHKVQHITMLYRRSEAQYRRNKRCAGYRLLLWHAQYMQRSRVYTKWAHQRTAKQTVLKAFSAWIGSFIEKNKLRQQIYERCSHSHSHFDTTFTTTAIEVRSVNTTAGTPLKRVLEQSSLQNLRTAVSFFIDYHTKTSASNLQRSARFTTDVDSPDGKEDVSSTSEDEKNSIYHLNLSKSYLKVLNTHSKCSLVELRAALRRQEGTGSGGISSSSSNDSNDNNDNNDNHISNAHRSTTSAKWLNRFTDRDDYISNTSEHVLSSDSNSIEDLLLNQTTQSTPNKHNNKHHSMHDTAIHTSTTPNKHYDSIHSGGLMDRAIHESFVLSPHKSRPAHIPTLSTDQDNNQTNHNSAYFMRVTTTGGFCTEVDVDSDIETQLVASFKRSADHVNKSIHTNGRYKSIDEAARRLAVQRSFSGWYEAVAVLYVRCTAKPDRVKHPICAEKHTISTRELATYVCGASSMTNTHVSIKRLIPAYTHTYTLSLINNKRRTFHIWRALYVQRMYQNNVNKVLARGKKVRLFAHWKVYVAMVKRPKHIHQVMRSRTLMPVFKQWRSKYKQRLLLSRVFSIHDAAWDYRQYTVPSPFQRLYAVLSAWKQYTGQKLRIRRHESNQRRALFFRGVTLLATHYHRWVDLVCSARQSRRQRAVEQKDLTTRCFRVWAEQTKHLQRQLCTLQYSILTLSPLRRVLHRWHHYVHRRCKTAPIAHYLRAVVQKVFYCLKTLRPLRLMEERKVHTCETSRLRISLRTWHGLFIRTQRYQKGLAKLTSAFYRLKRNLVYFAWPGRAESLLARQMQEYFAHKHKNRIMLVENPPHACPDGSSAEHKSEITSFLSKKRPTFAYRATKHKIIENLADVTGLAYYRTLCTTILEMWSASAKKDISVRYRALMVRQALQTRQVRKYMMQWVLNTPKTSYRRVVWMLKSAHKPHDDYAHKKEQEWVYNNAVKQRSGKNKSKTAKKQIVSAPPRAGGNANESVSSRSSVSADNVSTQEVTASGLSARYALVDCNNQAIDVCEGEYYTDSDDSNCDSSVAHHQVVWM